MPPRKRGGNTAAGAAAEKKLKAIPALEKKASMIADVINKSELPEMTRQMLCACIEDVMRHPKDKRHDLQVKIIAWINDALSSVEASLKKRVAEAESQANDAGAEQERLEKALAAANEAARKAEAEAKAKKDVCITAEMALENAKTALAAAMESQKSEDADVSKQEAEKNRLDEALNGVLSKLKAGGVADAEKQGLLKAASSIAKGLSLVSVLTSLLSALGKEPGERGRFDRLVVDQMESELKEKFTTLDAALKAREGAKQERAAKVEEAKANLEAATSAAADAVSERHAASTAAAEAATAAKEVGKEVKDYAPHMSEMASSLAACSKELARLETGPLAAFKELEEYDGIAKATWYQIIDGVKYEKLLLTIAASEPAPLAATSVEKLWATAQDHNLVTGCEKRTLEYILEHYDFVPQAKADLEAQVADLPED